MTDLEPHSAHDLLSFDAHEDFLYTCAKEHLEELAFDKVQMDLAIATGEHWSVRRTNEFLDCFPDRTLVTDENVCDYLQSEAEAAMERRHGLD